MALKSSSSLCRARRRRIALATGLLLGPPSLVWAQADAAAQTVTVSGRPSAAVTSLAGFGDGAAWRAPFAAVALGEQTLKDLGAHAPADLIRWDAALGDAYNAPGYWSQFTIRGFVLDPRYNLRRDGLPINAETVLGLENVQSLQALKGTSGIQAGTSAPGGLVNLVVKRPQGQQRSVELGFSAANNLALAADLGGGDKALGWRLNLAQEHLAPPVDASHGQRRLLALALDVQLGAAGRLEAEVEHSRQSQPTQPGFSLLGDRLPDARSISPRTNLNNQPWSLPVVSSGNTGSLRWTLPLSKSLQVQAQVMAQRLHTDDRVAFPFGCSASGQYDRYCTDGSFDLYDYRSEGERRASNAADVHLRWQVGGDEATVGLLAARYRARLNRQAFNWVGIASIDGQSITPSDSTLAFENTNRDERSLEAYARSRIRLASGTDLWAGLRSTRLQRQSALTNGDEVVDYPQSLTTPWLALSHQLSDGWVGYVSWGQGVESNAVPNQPAVFSNAGQPLPAMKSRQTEAGLRWRQGTQEASLIAFDIQRPATSDINSQRRIDGSAHHRGLEAAWDGSAGAWTWHASAMVLQAKREGSLITAQIGQRPTNVPDRAVRLHAGRDMAAVTGLNLHASVQHEGARTVLPDNSISLPAWTRLNLGARYASHLAGQRITWRLGLDNATNRRAWKESPYQFGHVYLFPLPERAWRGSAQWSF